MIGYTFRGNDSVKIDFAPSCKGVYSKRKEFAPRGSKFFPFRVDPFLEGLDVQKRKQEVTKVVSLVKNDKKKKKKKKKNYQRYPVPLTLTMLWANSAANKHGIFLTVLLTSLGKMFLLGILLCLSALGLGDILFFPRTSVCLSHSCLLCNLKTVQAIFTKLHININQH